ncbi:MAG: hypothetical protein FD126_361 [Elusimicrobia bacterium]|nr:MAG: hypothetical protein FD126_361 [Elusimicrobiota bacterium]
MSFDGPPVVRSAPSGPAGIGTTRGAGDLPPDIRLEPIVLAAMFLMLWAAA